MVEIGKVFQQPRVTPVAGAPARHRIVIVTNGIDGRDVRRLLVSNGYETVHVAAASIRDVPDAELVVILSADSQYAIDMLDGFSGCGIPIVLVCRDAAPVRASRCILNGADDYLAYPFDENEFLARVYGALRRYGIMHVAPGRVSDREPFVQLHPNDSSVLLNRTRIQLTDAQFGIMMHLVAARGKWLRTRVLQQEVLKANVADGASNVRFHILRLRRALGRWAVCLHGKQRLGYRWSPDPCGALHCACYMIGTVARDRARA